MHDPIAFAVKSSVHAKITLQHTVIFELTCLWAYYLLEMGHYFSSCKKQVNKGSTTSASNSQIGSVVLSALHRSYVRFKLACVE